MTLTEFRGRSKHGSGWPLDMHVIGRLDSAFVNAECLMVEMEHRYSMPDKRVGELVSAPRRDLQRESCCLAELTCREVGVHLPCQARDDRVRVLLLGVRDAHLVFVRWLF